MARPFCSSGDSRSSAPIPLIGLYTAGATSVCLILILCDIISSFRRKTRYVPCKLFSLNSATLTLLAIASKLPVDLTTYMPSVSDQLSKLTGTTVVCLSIAFLMPSLAINGETESITNMIALSIFVVTIAVNVCIQIYTGVIFLFIVEHIMILCCMVMLLSVLWAFSIVMNYTEKSAVVEAIRNIFRKAKTTSLLHQVQLWYMSSCISNPQHVLRGGDYVLSLVTICFICLIVVSQAAFRSLFHKLDTCQGVSDYGWSVSIILGTQIVTIAVGGFASIFRWITMVFEPPLHLKNNDFEVEVDGYFDIEKFYFLNLVKKRELQKDSVIYLCYLLLKGVIIVTATLIFWILGAPLYVIRVTYSKLRRIFCSCCTANLPSSSVLVFKKWKTELKEVFHPTKHFPEWIMRICIKDMNKWMDLNDKSPPNYLVQLLLRPRRHASQTLLRKLEQFGIDKGDYKLSCLSLVVLVKVIALSMSFTLAEPIMQALDEAFEMIQYIDKKINVGSFEDRRKRQFAKVLLAFMNIHLSKKDSTASHRSVDEAISSIENEYKAFPVGYAGKEMEIIKDFVIDQEYASIEELYEDLEELFVDMLLFFLPQLPTVIHKEVCESPYEVHEERARSVLKILCKLKLLEDKVQWLFPEGSRVTREDDDDQSARNFTIV
ncbi:hypothetical protein Sjap_025706 [Stephania japonica]|uniref:Uncharacterized protein n=1 Tax=Stephania japonica TaxID=461633 RepID=A0AAP0E4S8_9MAGN